ncbi:unnamed protein product [Gongylonema pulchrum]|uniref:Protein sleepless n=1 Tax=Gongylonema pulchrum TaxID=637853 RepID=A0A183CZU7_9BILA|nr:unnamed protein product [Gongylonema pulchrum]
MLTVLHSLLIDQKFLWWCNNCLFVSKISETEHIACHDCLSNNPSCKDICHGKYCYKAEFIADGVTTIKRGCLNQTDDGFPVRGCDEAPSDLPGSDVKATERMCICQSDRCNNAAHLSFTSVVLGLSALSRFLSALC